jgi:hypothetical protein
MIPRRNEFKRVVAFRILLLSISCIAGHLNAQDAQASTILAQSQKAMESLNSQSYSTTTTKKIGTVTVEIVQKIFIKKNSDGTVWQRVETTSSGVMGTRNLEVQNIHIENNDGTWELFPNKRIAVRYEFVEKSRNLMAQTAGSLSTADSPKKDDSTYVLTEKVNDNEPIYVVAKTLSEQTWQKTREKANQIVAAAYPDSNLDVGDKVPYLIESYIRKSDNFLMGQITYSKDGDLLSSIMDTNIQVNLPLADELFLVPDSYKSITVTKPEDMVQYETQ